MCILCNAESLRLLVAPLASLSNLELAESIRIAREAAMQLVLDTADALPDMEDANDAVRGVGPDGYAQYIVERAERDGIADADEVREWMDALSEGAGLRDARVQAFLSSSTEGLAVYITQIREKQAVLERFLEIPAGAALFGGIGAHGEISLDYGDERYVVLAEEEAMQIAVERISDDLWEQDPMHLLAYSSLPDDAVEILVAAQKQNSHDKANEILAGIIDVAALAEDAVRQTGYGRFVAEGLTEDFSEQRFGDLVIVRLRHSDAAQDEG